MAMFRKGVDLVVIDHYGLGIEYENGPDFLGDSCHVFR